MGNCSVSQLKTDRGNIVKKKIFVCLMMCCLLLVSCAESNGSTVDTTTTADNDVKTTTEVTTSAPVTDDREEIRYSYQFKNFWETGVTAVVEDGNRTINLRVVKIDIPGDGDAIEIFQMTDVHFSFFYDNESQYVKNSFDEWGDLVREDGSPVDHNATVETFKSCVNYAADSDCIVVTGDLSNFYSQANLDCIEKYIFNAKANINPEMRAKMIAVCGNHDATLRDYRAANNVYLQNRENVKKLFSKYNQRMDYYSYLIDERVMVVQLDNATGYDIGEPRFSETQKLALERDVALAKEKGYTVLLFCHIPLPSRNFEDGYTNYDANAYQFDASTKAVYDIITNNAEVIRGIFAGHAHNDSYSELIARTSEGRKAFVPQYVLKALYTGDGDMVKIVLQ